MPQTFTEFIQTLIAETQDQSIGTEAWRGLWDFTRAVKNYFPEGTDLDAAFDETDAAVRRLGGWDTLALDDVDDCETAFEQFAAAWGKIRYRAGDGPLEQALAKAEKAPLNTARGQKENFPATTALFPSRDGCKSPLATRISTCRCAAWQRHLAQMGTGSRCGATGLSRMVFSPSPSRTPSTATAAGRRSFDSTLRAGRASAKRPSAQFTLCDVARTRSHDITGLSVFQDIQDLKTCDVVRTGPRDITECKLSARALG
jgi:hypothetical protein